MGKSRLAREAAVASGTPILTGGASPEGTPAYGPVVEVLRAGLRRGGLELHPALALLMPELGPCERDRRTRCRARSAAPGVRVHRGARTGDRRAG